MSPDGLHFKDADSFRTWLEEHHERSQELWLIYYKKATGKASVHYEEAVREALCFGWIDSTVKRIDDEQYMQRFTPRNVTSSWSDLNKQRVAELITLGKMTPAGMVKIEAAKENGFWEQGDKRDFHAKIPQVLREQLERDREAKEKFDLLAPGQKRDFLGWLAEAKRPETTLRRIGKMIRMLKAGKRAGEW